jgi:multicomponent Na+:H+ antiporter subunit D
MIPDFPPGIIFVLGSLLIPFTKGKSRNVLALALPLLTLGIVWSMPSGSELSVRFMDFQLILVQVDKMSFLFGLIFSLTTFIGMLFMLHQKSNLEFSAGFFYAGSALGVVYAGDLMTMFFFWEMLTFGAIFLILARNTDRATAAAMRYLLIHVIGGLILLAGIILHIQAHAADANPAAIGQIGLGNLSGRLIFLGFGLNCAWPILHSWLTDTYPESSAGGIVFMATFTTKTAIFVLLRTFAGEHALIWIGMAMATFPIFYAVIENDLRRVLAYSLINQVGFMVIGIGIGTDLSLNGANAHVVSDILFKGLLFMSLGAVMYRTGTTKATDLGGLYKSMPFTCMCCIIGAASISAFPLFSGFVSKSMIMSAVAEERYPVVWLALLFASAGVFHHAGIKIPFFTFFGHDAGHRVKEAPPNMRLAMGITAALCVIVGTFPHQTLYRLLPTPTDYVPYTAAHVITQSQLLLFSALAFVMLLLSGIYPAEIRSVNLDTDLVYRKLGRLSYRVCDQVFNGINTWCDRVIAHQLTSAVSRFFSNGPARILVIVTVPYWKMQGKQNHELTDLKRHLYERARIGTFPIGITAVLAVIFLAIFILK